MATFMVVGNEIFSSDGGVYTLEEAYQMREELKLCISQMETRLTKRAVDLLSCPQCEGNLHNGYCQKCKAAFEPANH